MEKPTIHALLPVPVAFCHQCGICYGYDEQAMCVYAMHMLDEHLSHDHLLCPVTGCDRTPFMNILAAVKNKNCELRGVSG